MSEVQDKTQALLETLWRKNRPIIEERLAILDRAAAASSAGSIPDDLRKEANGTAHKLAGALGMYGYDEGTRIARELEIMLAAEGADSGRLNTLVGELRATVFPNG